MYREKVLMDEIEKGQDGVTDENLSKVTLKVGRDGTSYVLDKTLLRLSSPEFEKLLSTNERCYEVKDVEPNVFQEITRHIYMFSEWNFNGNLVETRHRNPTISSIIRSKRGKLTVGFLCLVETCDLIRAAGNYGLPELYYIALNHISTLPFDGLVRNFNACYAFNVVRNLEWDSGGFVKKILCYICKNAKAIFAADYFLDLSCETLVEILREDNLEIDGELDVFKVVLRWGIHNLLKISKFWTGKTLREMLDVPLQHIRFCNMTTFEIQNYILPLGIFTPDQQQLMNEAFKTAENQFYLLEIGCLDNEDEPSLKLRKYLLSIPSQRDQYRKASMEEISRAELFVAKFKFEEMVGELREEFALKEIAFKEELALANASLQEEIRKHREVTMKEISRPELFVSKFEESLEILRGEFMLKEIAFKEELAQANASFQEEIRKKREVTMKASMAELRKESLLKMTAFKEELAIAHASFELGFQEEHKNANLAFQAEIRQEIVALQNSFQKYCPMPIEKEKPPSLLDIQEIYRSPDVVYIPLSPDNRKGKTKSCGSTIITPLLESGSENDQTVRQGPSRKRKGNTVDQLFQKTKRKCSSDRGASGGRQGGGR